MSRIVGKLTAVWTKEGDPEFDEVGEEHARAGIRIDFEDEEEFAKWVRGQRLLFMKVSVEPILSVVEGSSPAVGVPPGDDE